MGLSGLEQGYAFGGRYRIVRCIAAGGMGAVYEVIHIETERRRALKVMLPELVHSVDLRDRFKREAKITANVVTEFIVEVFDAGVDQATGMPFLVMELLDGEELGKRVLRAGRLPGAEVAIYLSQVATALDRTHAASIVHRDLKPENLFLTLRDDGSPRIKILDFGISKVITDGTTSAHATKTLGTPLYMAPEQVAAEPLSPATDLYSLALIAYTLLVGSAYWQEEADRADNVLAFAMLTCNGPVEEPTARAARHGVTLPPTFDTWFRHATQRDPRRRFTRASEQIRALAQALDVPLPSPSSHDPVAFESTAPKGAPAGSATVEPWSASQRGSARRASVVAPFAIVGVVVAIGALAGGYWALHGGGRTPGEAPSASVSVPNLATQVARDALFDASKDAAGASEPRSRSGSASTETDGGIALGSVAISSASTKPTASAAPPTVHKPPARTRSRAVKRVGSAPSDTQPPSTAQGAEAKIKYTRD